MWCGGGKACPHVCPQSCDTANVMATVQQLGYVVLGGHSPNFMPGYSTWRSAYTVPLSKAYLQAICPLY